MATTGTVPDPGLTATASQPKTPPTGPKRNRARDFQLFLLFILLLGVMLSGAKRLPAGWNWIGAAAALLALVLVMGQWSCRRWLGILIDYRNLMSLSRFQAMVWTIMILSGFVAMVALRFKLLTAGHLSGSAMDVIIPPELWALMGISTASLVGAPMLLQPKQDKDPSASAVAKAATVLGEQAADVRANSYGTLYSNPSIKDAAITDMLQGDEIANTAYLDLAKVQMFLFTIIGGLIYGYAIFNTLSNAAALADAPKAIDALKSFPQLPTGMVTLLGISHAGYLTSKTADRTPSTS